MGVYTGTLPSSSLAVGAGLPAAWTQQAGSAVGALGTALTSYTPTLTGFTLGNGTVVGAYSQVGQFVIFRAVLTFGTTSAAAAAVPTMTVPVAATANQISTVTGGLTASFLDSGTANYIAIGKWESTTTVSASIVGSSGIRTNCSTTTPFTWAVNDQVSISGWYEAA